MLRKAIKFLIFSLLCCASTFGQASSGPGAQSGGGGGGSTSPGSLTTFFTGNFGLAPDDCGNAACTTPVSPAIIGVKWCYDGSSSGGTNFTSTKSATITNTALTANVATITATNTLAPGNLITITGSANGGGAFNVTNALVITAAAGSFTFNLTHANIGSAADTGTAVANCANFTAANVGNVIDITTAGAAGVTLHTTIASVTNGTTIVLGNAITPGSLTNVKFWFGSDATTPLQNWINNINNGSLSPTALLVHAGYFPRKWYYTTQTLNLDNPIGGIGASPISYGSPEPFSLSTANEGLQIWGTGSLSSGIVVAPAAAFNFNCANVTHPAAAFYYRNWNGTSLKYFGIIADQLTSLVTTGCPSFVGGLIANSAHGMYSDNNAHEDVVGIQVQGFHNAASNMVGHSVNNCFESRYSLMTMYANDTNGNYVGPTDGCVYDTIAWEGFSGAGNVNLQTAGARTRITNSKILGQSTCLVASCDGPAGGYELAFGANFDATSAGAGAEEFIIQNTLIQSFTANNLGTVSNSAAKGRVLLDGVHLLNTAVAGASTNLLNNASANLNFNVSFGSWECSGACANGITNVSGAVVQAFGTKNLTGSNTFAGSGAGSVFGFFTTATGWNGLGVNQGSSWIANQGAACTNGELALSAGWQSTGSATVTAVAGTGQTCSWTITTGTTTAANPTVTDTLTTPLPTATTVCELNIHGGTHTAAANDAFTNTTLSATAPVFTANFTPTAGGTTYLVTRRCGP